MAKSFLICVVFWIPLASWAQATSDSPDGGEASALPEDTESRRTTDDHPRDAGQREAATKRREDPCAAEEKRIEERKKWLAERSLDQAARGVPNPFTGVPNLTAIHCEQHPEDEQCRLGAPPTSFEPDELSIDAMKTPEDRDPYVIGLKRELQRCRSRFRNR
jgi:hypothetical protein